MRFISSTAITAAYLMMNNQLFHNPHSLPRRRCWTCGSNSWFRCCGFQSFASLYPNPARAGRVTDSVRLWKPVIVEKNRSETASVGCHTRIWCRERTGTHTRKRTQTRTHRHTHAHWMVSLISAQFLETCPTMDPAAVTVVLNVPQLLRSVSAEQLH